MATVTELRFVLSDDREVDGGDLVPAIASLPGVRGVDVHPSVHEVWVRGHDVDPQAVKAAIEASGHRLDDAYPQAVDGPL
ncbi:MAG TPA: hypothetical protein VM307_04040 [Egibacteraceae bacterium]|nr:hypothetical protein [Egibacteraceae bacterium]